MHTGHQICWVLHSVVLEPYWGNGLHFVWLCLPLSCWIAGILMLAIIHLVGNPTTTSMILCARICSKALMFKLGSANWRVYAARRVISPLISTSRSDGGSHKQICKSMCQFRRVSLGHTRVRTSMLFFFFLTRTDLSALCRGSTGRRSPLRFHHFAAKAQKSKVILCASHSFANSPNFDVIQQNEFGGIFDGPRDGETVASLC